MKECAIHHELTDNYIDTVSVSVGSNGTINEHVIDVLPFISGHSDTGYGAGGADGRLRNVSHIHQTPASSFSNFAGSLEVSPDFAFLQQSLQPAAITTCKMFEVIITDKNVRDVAIDTHSFYQRYRSYDRLILGIFGKYRRWEGMISRRKWFTWRGKRYATFHCRCHLYRSLILVHFEIANSGIS